MKVKKVYYETDEMGKHKIIEGANGVKVKILREPSDLYKKKAKKRSEEEKARQDAERGKSEREKLISNKMRELAIKELEAEGKL